MGIQSGFQVTLDLEGRSSLVLGGDEEALEKVTRLLDAGARVTVVNPTLHTELRKLTASAKIIHRGRTFRSTDSQGMTLVLNAVKDDPGLAKTLYELSKAERFLVWSIDRPDLSTVMMPALVRRGALRIAISTGGASPALASVLRRNLEGIFTEEFEQFVDWLGAMREELKKTELSDLRRRERLLEVLEGFQLTGQITYPGSWKGSDAPELESVGKEGG